MIFHFVSSIDKTTGGPARSITQLISNVLRFSNYKLNLITMKSIVPIIEDFDSKNGKILFCDKKLGGRIDLKDKLNKSIKLFHGHGIWQAPVHQMAKYAQRNNIPYIITPRGMLEPWSLSQGKWKKIIALFLFQKEDLIKATCIHATSEMEAYNIRQFGFRNAIAVIPNGIEIESYPKLRPKKSDVKKILFLSRIHKKKGVEILIEAWSLLNEDVRKNWMVEVVGNGETEYIRALQELIDEKKVGSQIQIKQPVFGPEKINLYRESSLFVLPTYSENFGNVIAESLASFTPVITTKGTPWRDLETHHCGWWIDIGVSSLKKTLEEALSKESHELIEMGERGRSLVEEKYSMEIVAKKMIQMYDWILKKRKKPSFVQP